MWDEEVDLLVLGSGAGGLSAAVTGAHEGLATLVLEKTEWLGGTTAYSAGTCWVPGNRFLRAAGRTDDVAEASRYLDALVGDRAPRARPTSRTAMRRSTTSTCAAPGSAWSAPTPRRRCCGSP